MNTSHIVHWTECWSFSHDRQLTKETFPLNSFTPNSIFLMLKWLHIHDLSVSSISQTVIIVEYVKATKIKMAGLARDSKTQNPEGETNFTPVWKKLSVFALDPLIKIKIWYFFVFFGLDFWFLCGCLVAYPFSEFSEYIYIYIYRYINIEYFWL